jgi:hypothetical protein
MTVLGQTSRTRVKPDGAEWHDVLSPQYSLHMISVVAQTP